MKYLKLNHVQLIIGANRLFLLGVIVCGCSFYAKAQSSALPAGAQQASGTGVKTTTTAKQTPVAAAGAATYIDNFFKKYKDEGTGPAIDYIFGTNKLFANNNAQIMLLKAKLDSLRQTVGEYIGKELIAQKSSSPSLVFYSYLAKHENQPVRFTFMFYKPHSEWVLYRFKYDDQMDSELEEAGKINNKRQ